MTTLPHDDPSYNQRVEEAQHFLIGQCLPSPVCLDTGDPLAPDSYKRLHERQCA